MNERQLADDSKEDNEKTDVENISEFRNDDFITVEQIHLQC